MGYGYGYGFIVLDYLCIWIGINKRTGIVVRGMIWVYEV